MRGTDARLEPEVEARLDRMLDAEGVDRLRTTAVAVTGVMCALAPVIALVTGMPDAIYYVALVAVFIGSVWWRYVVARNRGGAGGWPAYAFVAGNFALLTFTLIVPNPFSEIAQHPFAAGALLRFGNFIYFFVMLASLAFAFSPAVVLWGGFCGAAFWSLGRLWVATRPGMVVMLDDAELGARRPDGSVDFDIVFETVFQPNFVDVGVWVQEATVFMGIAVMLAMVVRGSRRLVMRRAAEERRTANLARYLPAQMAEQMAETDVPFGHDREAEVAVLFTDIVGFTGWAEAHRPQEVVALLREVHGFVAEEVFRAGGVLDKFIGDGAMATFGVAQAEGAAARALGCAEAVLVRARDLNAARVARGEAPVRLSVGVHTGPVTIGDVGAAGRMELAVVGDAVNVASRLEALNRRLGCGAVVSDALMQAAGGPADGWSARGETALPGRAGSVAIWTRPLEPDDPARPDQGAPPDHGAPDHGAPDQGGPDHGVGNRPSAAAG